MMKIRVILAGASGWTGSAVAAGILDSPDIQLVGAVARTCAGRDIGEVLGREASGVIVKPTPAEALAAVEGGALSVDAFVDYTSALQVRANILWALSEGLSAVVGSSGLSADDYAAIDALAREKKQAVIACGNFSITAALAKHFALLAARYLPHREIFDYAHGGKIDAPSGTARELAEALADVRANQLPLSLDKTVGPIEARGLQLAGTPVHSVRLPGYTLAFETQFGLPDERLSIRHDSGSGAGPYVEGTLLALRKLSGRSGLTRGMDTLLFT